MSAGPPRSERTARAGAVALAGVALLIAAALLAPGGATGTVRTVVACLAILVVPGWLVGRLADEEADAIVRAVGGVVATLAVLALCGFVAFEVGLRVATAVFAVPLLVVVAVAALLGAAEPPVRRASPAPLVVALAIGCSALLGGWVTHLALPAVPVERAFSIEAARAVASPKGVVVTVTVTRVRTAEPMELTLYVGVHQVAVTPIPPAASQVRLEAALPAGTSTCPSRVWVKARTGAFLTPPVRCVGW